MFDAAELEKQQDHVQALYEALHEDNLPQVHRLINQMHPSDAARLLESLPGEDRQTVWELVDAENSGEVLIHLGESVRLSLIRQMDSHALVAATEGLDIDDLADLLPEMPEEVIQRILNTMDEQNRERLETVLPYPEDTAGGLMNVDTITVRAEITLDVVLRYLRRRGNIPESTDSLMVVNRKGKYLGLLPITELITRDPTLTVAEVMVRNVEGINAASPASEVATLFERRDLISAPVVNDEGKLLGRITIDDVVDVIRDEADHSVLSMAGLSEEEDLFAPAIPSARRRAVWLGVNLVTAFIAAAVVGQFQGVIERLVALAVLMPIVASMGGIAGNQVLALVIRSLAQGVLVRENTRWLIGKEISVSMLNGLLFATLVGSAAIAWFHHLGIGLVIAGAMVINLLCAASAGVIVPVLLRRSGIDPALAGPVILTTITDVMGFFSFLGLAALFLL